MIENDTKVSAMQVMEKDREKQDCVIFNSFQNLDQYFCFIRIELEDAL